MKADSISTITGSEATLLMFTAPGASGKAEVEEDAWVREEITAGLDYAFARPRNAPPA